MKKNLLLFALFITTIARSFAQYGIVTTLAGTGPYGAGGDGIPATTAGIFPKGFVITASGDFIVASNYDYLIRRVTTSGLIYTVAGTTTAGSTGDGGPATAADITNPWGLTADAAGNIHFTESTGKIRKVSTSGIITTIAGNGTTGFAGDGGPATAAIFRNTLGLTSDVAGNLYVCDCYNNRVRKISAAGIVTTYAGNGTAGFSGDGSAATAAKLSSPMEVHMSASGDLYISDVGNHRVRKVSASGIITTVAGSDSSGFAGDGGQATAARLTYPSGCFLDASGTLYISDEGNSRIRTVSSSGIIQTIAGVGTAAFSGDGSPSIITALYAPGSIIKDSRGNVFFGDFGNARLRKIGCILPAVGAITGASVMCSTTSATLTDTTTGGTWSSSNPAVATVSTSGSVYAIAGGTAIISYAKTNACGTYADTQLVNVLALPTGGVGGLHAICGNSITSLTGMAATGTWATSNPGVASVSSAGVLYGVAYGTAVISYNYSNSCGAVSDSHLVRVDTLLPVAAVTGAATICPAATTTLAATVAGGTWVSGSPSVASVNSAGLVRAVAAGVATISYLTGNACGTRLATHNLTVNATPSPGSISGAVSLCESTDSLFTNFVTGGTWSSGNVAVATVSTAGRVYGVTAGSANISYTVTNSCGTAVAQKNINIYPAGSCTAAINEEGHASSVFGVYPNPATDFLIVQLPEGAIGARVQIIDLLGKCLANINATGSEGKLSLNTSGLPTGSYLLRLITESQVYSAQFFVK